MVYECVINWVKHELDFRYEFLPKLMEHVRLPLVSIEYISKKVVNEPLLKNSSKCTELLIEALHFNALTTQLQKITIPQTIRYTPRHSRNKVILISSAKECFKECYISIYDPETNLLRNIISEMTKNSTSSNLALIKKHLVFSFSNRKLSSVDMLNLSLQSPSWVKVVDMLVHRRLFGVGVLHDCIYAVGGNDFDNNYLNSTEVFYESCKKWELVSRMSTKRSRLGVGVINNLLYAVGGWNNSLILQSVECYDPIFNKWTTVANMSVSRADPGVGVLDGIMYVFGGFNHFGALKSAEAYSPTTGVWSFITDMHQCRKNPRVVTLNGLLYVIGGIDYFDHSTHILKSIEIYDPDTNTWSIEKFSSTSIERIVGAVVIDRSPHFKNN